MLSGDPGSGSAPFHDLRVGRSVATEGDDDRHATWSIREFTDTPSWTSCNNETMWQYYLKDGPVPGGPDVSPYAAPMRAGDLTGLPPARVVVCEFDPLRDEGIAYAQRLLQAGVPTELTLYPGTFHGCTLLAQTAITRKMREDLIFSLCRALSTGSAAADSE